MDLKWQDGAILRKKLKKPSRTPEEVSQAKKQYELPKSNSLLILRVNENIQLVPICF
jgi:hypothetical protein